MADDYGKGLPVSCQNGPHGIDRRGIDAGSGGILQTLRCRGVVGVINIWRQSSSDVKSHDQ